MGCVCKLLLVVAIIIAFFVGYILADKVSETVAWTTSYVKEIVEDAKKSEFGIKAPKPKLRGYLLAGGLGILTGFVGGSIISIFVVLFFFKIRGHGSTLSYQKRVISYRADEEDAIPSSNGIRRIK